MKKIISFITMFCLLMSLVTAFDFPMPVLGVVTLNGEPQGGLNVIISNTRTGDVMSTETNKAGEFQVELTDFPNSYKYGDIIYVKACSGSPECQKNAVAEGGSIKLNFDVGNDVTLIFKGIAVQGWELAEAIGYYWFVGFLGLVAYWYKKSNSRGKKMLQTFFKNLRKGKYKK